MKQIPYTQLFVHYIIVVQSKECHLTEDERQIISDFIRDLIEPSGHKLLAIDGVPGHLHVLVRFNPDRSVSETARWIKRSTAEFINSQQWHCAPFRWKPGYGAFTYSKSQLTKAIAYIKNQKNLHEQDMLKDTNPGNEIENDIFPESRLIFDFVDIW